MRFSLLLVELMVLLIVSRSTTLGHVPHSSSDNRSPIDKVSWRVSCRCGFHLLCQQSLKSVNLCIFLFELFRKFTALTHLFFQEFLPDLLDFGFFV